MPTLVTLEPLPGVTEAAPKEQPRAKLEAEVRDDAGDVAGAHDGAAVDRRERVLQPRAHCQKERTDEVPLRPVLALFLLISILSE